MEQKDLHMVFIDLEKVYNKIPQNFMWRALEKHKVPAKYITLIKEMYNNVVKRTGFGSSNQAIATENIRQGRPVYLSGKPEGVIFNGHAWVLDGEWGNYYHVNWGMRGAHDGYFTKNVFHMTNRQAYDSVIDAYTYDRASGSPHYYVWWFRMVTYTL